MAGEDLINFLKTRNIPDNVAEKLKEDKIDINVINVMTDEELGQYIVKYGDRLAVRAFCQQRSESFQTPGVKSALMQRVRQKLTEQRSAGSSRPRPFGNQHAAKDNRRVEIGWLHFNNGDFHQVRTRHGGGTRHLSVQKTVTMGELLEMGKSLFFPNGKSPKGSAEDFVFDIRDFSHENVPLESTVNQLYEQTKVKMLRIYTCSREKEKISTDEQLSDISSDFEDAEDTQRKDRTIQRQSARKRRRRYHDRTTNDQKNQPGISAESDVIPTFSAREEHGETDNSSKQSQSPSLEIIYEEILDSSFEAAGTHPQEAPDNPEAEDDCLILSHTEDADEALQFPPVMAINVSAEDLEIQFGPVSSHDEESLDSTLPWNQDDINSSQHSRQNDGAASLHSSFAQPGQYDKEIHCVQIRRINVVSDLINIFMEPGVMNVQLKVELKNEKAFDSDGVSREVYSAFWERFLELCEGEDERVPRLRPDFTEKHWEAVGRIWLKGYLDHNMIPIQLSPAFILACFQGVSSVDEELLMMSFHRFISAHERLAVDKALQGNVDEDVEEDLLDLFSRMGSHNVPTKENVQASLSTIAHKVLQEPKFVIDSFHSCFYNAVPSLASKENVIKLYDSKRATNKKVAQMIKPSSESLNSQEQTALNHLLRYVRSIDQKKLEKFLRFCTGSTVLCKDTIEITFNRLSGLNRRVVAHTCGAVLELPCTYVSYPEFRTELDNILAGDCFTMDIL
ncbi:uncharacterized protein LOC119796722 [Cyprinodon tularosa]|uniref:uncharacterized protein LOC119796722 n=1 Tax=Cyprinodon tularosa TaxID=77115 RepID=UPI0018E22118|nr:uncharacterized protein LOC119796722 [Cyprinodon tularosa]